MRALRSRVMHWNEERNSIAYVIAIIACSLYIRDPMWCAKNVFVIRTIFFDFVQFGKVSRNFSGAVVNNGFVASALV